MHVIVAIQMNVPQHLLWHHSIDWPLASASPQPLRLVSLYMVSISECFYSAEMLDWTQTAWGAWWQKPNNLWICHLNWNCASKLMWEWSSSVWVKKIINVMWNHKFSLSVNEEWVLELLLLFPSPQCLYKLQSLFSSHSNLLTSQLDSKRRLQHTLTTCWGPSALSSLL